MRILRGSTPAAPPAPGPLWSSHQYQNQTVAVWREIARHIRNQQTVIGYDLLNEPEVSDKQALLALYGRLIKAIRQVDPDHVLFLEGTNSSTDFSFFTKASCANMAYSCHIYWWSGDSTSKFNSLQSLGQQQARPFWIGEFGEPLSYSWIHRKVQQIQERDAFCGWSLWTWKKVRGGPAGLVTEPVSDNWRDVMSRVRTPWLPSLSPEVIAAGLKEFPELMKRSHDPDERMLKALNLK